MRAFIVKEGETCLVVRENVDQWVEPIANADHPGRLRYHNCKKENIFYREDIIADPTMNIDPPEDVPEVTARQFARKGWYGFRREGWIILVPVNNVIVR